MTPESTLSATRVHVDVADLIAGVRNRRARHELAEAFHRWRHRGSFSVCMEALDYNNGSTARKAVANALATWPVIKCTAKYIANVRCREYIFHKLHGCEITSDSRAKKQPAYSTCSLTLDSLSDPLALPARLAVSLPRDAEWYCHRAVRWWQWTADRNLPLPSDPLALTVAGQHVLEAMRKYEKDDRIEVDRQEKPFRYSIR